jgi:hypothetical protein
MQTVEAMSRKFDFLQLHRWAWDQKLIRKPRQMDESHLQTNTKRLAKIVAIGALKRRGLVFEDETHDGSLTLRVPELAAWLDATIPSLDQPVLTKLTRPTAESPVLTLIFQEGRVSCAATQLKWLEEDLTTYESLAYRVTQSEVESPFGKVSSRRSRIRKATK